MKPSAWAASILALTSQTPLSIPVRDSQSASRLPRENGMNLRQRMMNRSERLDS
jgi:hypothetical protein